MKIDLWGDKNWHFVDEINQLQMNENWLFGLSKSFFGRYDQPFKDENRAFRCQKHPFEESK